jgi:hypothetical protein
VTGQLNTGPVFYAEKDFLPSTRLVINIFCATKCFEFVDTFLHSGLKGHDPSFLHGFHHIATGIVSWYVPLYTRVCSPAVLTRLFRDSTHSATSDAFKTASITI